MLKETGGGIARFFAVATPSKRQRLSDTSPLQKQEEIVVTPHNLENAADHGLLEDICHAAQASASDDLTGPTQRWAPLESPAPASPRISSPVHSATPVVDPQLAKGRTEEWAECFLPVLDGQLRPLPSPSRTSTPTGVNDHAIDSHYAPGNEAEDELPGPTQIWGAALEALSPTPSHCSSSPTDRTSMGDNVVCARLPTEGLPHSFSPTLSFHAASPKKTVVAGGISAPNDISPTLTW